MTARQAAEVHPCRACDEGNLLPLPGDARVHAFCRGLALGMSAGATFELCAGHRHIVGRLMGELAERAREGGR